MERVVGFFVGPGFSRTLCALLSLGENRQSARYAEIERAGEEQNAGPQARGKNTKGSPSSSRGERGHVRSWLLRGRIPGESGIV
jgi:hypothetical protein